MSTSTAAREGLFATTAQAARHGAFGVPALVVGDRLFWGQDRLHFVERALGGDPASVTEPRAPGPAVVEFFHDFSSPWSYLGSTQVARVAAAHGATLKYRPMLLGALFRAIGTPDVPLLATNAAKRAYVARDLDDWARHWKVPFRFPDHFPLRTVTPLRVALVEPAATPHLYAAAWADNRPIDDDTVLAEVLTAAGFDAPALLEATQTPAIKQALRANTDAACALGACGAPTFVVRATPDAAPVLFWGQDRLDQVGRALNGWRPAFG